MSDVLQLSTDGKSLPEFLSRLRPGSFVSPGGVESAFLFDSLERSAGKKLAAHEIADSDDSVLQDMGGATRSYPMEIYFVGENYDRVADEFFESLFERYAPDSPGVLHHPRWGDIPVIPVGVTQKENFIAGAGISRLTVEFRQTKSLTYPASSALSEGEVLARTDEIAAAVDGATLEVDVDDDTAYSRFRGQVKAVLNTISDVFEAISNEIGEVQSEITDIEQDLHTALGLLAAPSVITAQIWSVLKAGADVAASLPEKAVAYIDAAGEMIAGYTSSLGNLVLSADRRNAAVMLETVGALAVSASVRAAIATEFTTREAVGEVIDGLAELYAAYISGIDAAYASFDGSISRQFVPDHDLVTAVADAVAGTNRLLITRAFDLKTKRTVRLSSPSDALTLTWEMYGDIERLPYFLETNRITENEFWEIPSGREVAAYV